MYIYSIQFIWILIPDSNKAIWLFCLSVELSEMWFESLILHKLWVIIVIIMWPPSTLSFITLKKDCVETIVSYNEKASNTLN